MSTDSSSTLVMEVLDEINNSLQNGSLTSAEAKLEFIKRVSKEQLLECLADQDNDADDMVACKEMLKYFYNYELPVD